MDKKQAGPIVTCVLLAQTFGCWLFAFVAPGWFLFEFNSYLGITTVYIGPFLIHVCMNDDCDQIHYDKLESVQLHEAMPKLIELQTGCILVLGLCTMSGLCVVISARFKSKKYGHALGCMVFAVIITLILICRTASANKKISDDWDKVKDVEQFYLADKSKRVKIPYSLLVARIGTVLGIFGCISSFCMYRKSSDCAQQDQVLNLIPADQATDLTIMQETS